MSPRRIIELHGEVMQSWHSKLALEGRVMQMAAATGFNGDKSGSFKKMTDALEGNVTEQRGDRATENAGEPIDLESDHAKAIQMEMEAEAEVFQRALERHTAKN